MNERTVSTSSGVFALELLLQEDSDEEDPVVATPGSWADPAVANLGSWEGVSLRLQGETATRP